MKKKQVSFSTTISIEVKKTLERYCKKKGIKINHFVENAILEALENEMDKELTQKRELEENVDWDESA